MKENQSLDSNKIKLAFSSLDMEKNFQEKKIYRKENIFWKGLRLGQL